MLTQCRECEARVSAGAASCPVCAAVLPAVETIHLSSDVFQGAGICSNCLHIGKPRARWAGSWPLAILLMLPLYIPGLIYIAMTWRNKKYLCRSCGREGIAKLDSPQGTELAVRKGRLLPKIGHVQLKHGADNVS